MEKSSKNINEIDVVKKVIFNKLLIIVPTSIYVCGYLIHSTYVQRLGITNISIARPIYIEIGMVFIVLSLTLILLPMGAVGIIKSLRSKTGLENRGIYRTAFAGVNYLIILVFFSLFVTKYEWVRQVYIPYVGSINLGKLFTFYMFIVFTFLVIASRTFDIIISLKKKILKTRRLKNNLIRILGRNAKHIIYPQGEDIKKLSDKSVQFAISTSESIWSLLTAFTLYFDLVLFFELPWLNGLLQSSKFYLACLVMLGFVLARLIRRTNKLESSIERKKFIGAAIVLPLAILFLSVISYSFGPFKYIPISRGGILPETKSVFLLKDGTREAYLSLLDHQDTIERTMPLLVFFENESSYYVKKKFFTDLEKLNSSDGTPLIFKIKKTDIVTCYTVSYDTRRELKY